MNNLLIPTIEPRRESQVLFPREVKVTNPFNASLAVGSGRLSAYKGCTPLARGCSHQPDAKCLFHILGSHVVVGCVESRVCLDIEHVVDYLSCDLSGNLTGCLSSEFSEDLSTNKWSHRIFVSEHDWADVDSSSNHSISDRTEGRIWFSS